MVINSPRRLMILARPEELQLKCDLTPVDLVDMDSSSIVRSDCRYWLDKYSISTHAIMSNIYLTILFLDSRETTPDTQRIVRKPDCLHYQAWLATYRCPLLQQYHSWRWFLWSVLRRINRIWTNEWKDRQSIIIIATLLQFLSWAWVNAVLACASGT